MQTNQRTGMVDLYTWSYHELHSDSNSLSVNFLVVLDYFGVLTLSLTIANVRRAIIILYWESHKHYYSQRPIVRSPKISLVVMETVSTFSPSRGRFQRWWPLFSHHR